MRPVRVSFIIDDLSRAGTESQLIALIRTLDRNRVQPSLVLLNGLGDVSRSLEPADCPVLRLGISRLFGTSSLMASRTLTQFWRAHKPDVAQFYFMDSAYFGVPIARWCGIRRIIRVRNNLGHWLTARHRLLNRLIRPMVHYILTNSDAGRQAVIDHDGMAPERVVVIENGVDLDRFPRFAVNNPSNSRCTVGAVANLRPVKNIDGLMRAARQVLTRHPDVRFVVAGDGEQHAELDRLRSELGILQKFELLGSVKDIPGFLSECDITVLPSHAEGMSNALMEYMAAGRAIVATDVGANAKLLDGGRHGLLVPARDDQALSEAIASLAGSPSRRAELGSSARDHIAAHYSRDAMRRRFEEFYHRIASATYWK